MEVNLSPHVSDWMRSLGFTPYAEVPFPSSMNVIDLVGRNAEGELLAVELKRSLTKEVIRQTYRADLITARCYAGVGTKPSRKSLAEAEKCGIGVVSVVAGCVRVVLEPREKHPDDSFRRHYRQKICVYLDHMKPDGTAGRPCVKGEGAAQECYAAVQAYRAQHPKATYREMFGVIPNHYDSHKSMCAAMRMVEVRRAFAERQEKRRMSLEKIVSNAVSLGFGVTADNQQPNEIY